MNMDDSRTGDEAQQNMHTAMQHVIDTFDRSHLRKVQMVNYRCAAKCCENTAASLEQVQVCVDKCNEELELAQRCVEKSLNIFQNDLADCVHKCQCAEMPDSMDEATVKKMYEKCVIKCFDYSRQTMLPALMKGLKISLDSNLK